jgi:stress response protein YsnF
VITREQVSSVIDHTVYDQEGKKIGQAGHVFLDDATGEPEWATVRTGMFGNHESFVPIHEARLVEDRVEVPCTRSQVKDAPHVDVDSGGHLSEHEERELYRHYGVDWNTGRHRKGMATGDMSSTAAGAGTGAGAGAGAGGMAGAASSQSRERDRPADERGPEDDMSHGKGLMSDDRMRRGTPDDAMTRSEEQLRIHTEREEAGHARLRKYVVTEDVQQTVPVRHDEVRLEREPITDANREQALRGPDFREDEHEITLHREHAVAETEAVPVERVRMVQEEHVEQETVRGRVRKERIDAEIPEEADSKTRHGDLTADMRAHPRRNRNDRT